MPRLTIWILEESPCLGPVAAMTTPLSPSPATPAPATWTRASAQVGEGPQHPQRLATRGHESRSCSIERLTTSVPHLSVGVHVNPLHPPCPIKPRPSIAKCDPMPREPCGSTQTLKHQQNLLLHLPMQQSKPFPLFWYFSTEKKRDGERKQRKKKVRIPAKKLLYYTKGRNQTFCLHLYNPLHATKKVLRYTKINST